VKLTTARAARSATVTSVLVRRVTSRRITVSGPEDEIVRWAAVRVTG
jgi:hypothetical protein